jgi:hypothetical protein
MNDTGIVASDNVVHERKKWAMFCRLELKVATV